jgi:hypothetical protein
MPPRKVDFAVVRQEKGNPSAPQTSVNADCSTNWRKLLLQLSLLNLTFGLSQRCM